MNRITRTGYRLTALLPLLAAASALGQDGEDEAEAEAAFDRTPQRCIVVSRIRETEALDDQNILFRMRDDSVYRNTLPSKCPGLLRENRISYEVRSSRLCDIETITVLEDVGIGHGPGNIGGFSPGFTCRLGQFVPLSEAEVEDLDLKKKGRAGQEAIETSSVELEREDATEPEEAAAAPADEPAAAAPESEQ